MITIWIFIILVKVVRGRFELIFQEIFLAKVVGFSIELHRERCKLEIMGIVDHNFQLSI